MKSALFCLAAASLLFMGGGCASCTDCTGGPLWDGSIGGSCASGECAGSLSGAGRGLVGMLLGRGGPCDDGACVAGGLRGCGGNTCAGACGGACPLARAVAGELGTALRTAGSTLGRRNIYNSCLNGPCGAGRAPGPTSGAVTYPYYTTRGPRDFLSANPPAIGP